MYYKITNKESEAYKKLHEMRSNEVQWDKENKEAIELKTGQKWEGYFGKGGQQNFGRVTSYTGFNFTEPEKLDPKIWKRHKEHDTVFVPNTRTKAGREMEQFLTNGLKRGKFSDVFDILDLSIYGEFTFPYVEITGETIVLYLDDQQEPKDENLIEITKREFQELLKK